MPITGLVYGANQTSSVYEVANSLRFNDGSSDYLNLSLGTPSNRKIFTCSAWVKRASTGTYPIFWFGADSNNWFMVKYESDSLRIESKNSGSTIIDVRTNALYRDFSAWYHVLVVVDTTQGTASNRIKIYVNGVQETSFQTSTYPNQNTDLNVITTAEIGNQHTTQYFDGYMAEVVFVDGTAQANTDLGEFDSDTNIWKPKNVSGLTFGTNGFYLDFENSSSLGADVSGNGNNFTVNNLTSIDQTTDTCTNNFATLNSLINFNSGVFSEGNLAITFGDDTVSTIGLTKGRWYWEAQRTNSTNEAHFGIGVSNGFYSATSVVSDGDRLYVRGGTNNFNTASNLSILTFGSNSGTPASFGSGDILSFYLDLESSTKNIIIKKNDGATPLANVDLTYSGKEPIFPFCRMNSGCASSWNFGNPINSLSSANTDANGYGNFEYSPTISSVNYYAICTKNLAEFG